MNTLYYFITRKIIRSTFANIHIVFKSLFYMLSIASLSTILPIIFRTYLFFPTPNAMGILTIIYLAIFGILLFIRLIQILDWYDIEDEPHFVQQFIEDCCRSDNNLEEKYKQEKEVRLQVIKQKKEAKRLKAELINNRTDILDL